MLAAPEVADELRARLKVEKDRKAALLSELETLKRGPRNPDEEGTGDRYGQQSVQQRRARS